jgi:hypothetical protein
MFGVADFEIPSVATAMEAYVASAEGWELHDFSRFTVLAPPAGLPLVLPKGRRLKDVLTAVLPTLPNVSIAAVVEEDISDAWYLADELFSDGARAFMAILEGALLLAADIGWRADSRLNAQLV